MRATKDGEFRSSVYTQRPPYADFDAPAKFQAIQSIIEAWNDLLRWNEELVPVATFWIE